MISKQLEKKTTKKFNGVDSIIKFPILNVDCIICIMFCGYKDIANVFGQQEHTYSYLIVNLNFQKEL